MAPSETAGVEAEAGRKSSSLEVRGRAASKVCPKTVSCLARGRRRWQPCLCAAPRESGPQEGGEAERTCFPARYLPLPRGEACEPGAALLRGVWGLAEQRAGACEPEPQRRMTWPRDNRDNTPGHRAQPLPGKFRRPDAAGSGRGRALRGGPARALRLRWFLPVFPGGETRPGSHRDTPARPDVYWGRRATYTERISTRNSRSWAPPGRRACGGCRARGSWGSWIWKQKQLWGPRERQTVPRSRQ